MLEETRNQEIDTAFVFMTVTVGQDLLLAISPPGQNHGGCMDGERFTKGRRPAM
jgi:hypothetical protein